MPQTDSLRIVYKNAADAATLTASGSIAAGMPAANLKTNIKGEVLRVLGTSTALTAEWSSAQQLSCVIIPASNLSASATVRVQGYDAANALVIDTGNLTPCQGTVLENYDLSMPLNANSFNEGASIAAVYFERKMLKRVVTTITDTARTYLDISRLIVDDYFEPEDGADWGAALGATDLGNTSRAQSGDFRTDWAPTVNNMSFDMNSISAKDRQRLTQIIRMNSLAWFFVSLQPENYDPAIEQDFSIYGKIVTRAPIAYSQWRTHQSKFEIESW